MGDKELPYKLLKRVMATCTAADYGQISLAVMRRASSMQAAADAAATRGGYVMSVCISDYALPWDFAAEDNERLREDRPRRSLSRRWC